MKEEEFMQCFIRNKQSDEIHCLLNITTFLPALGSQQSTINISKCECFFFFPYK